VEPGTAIGGVLAALGLSGAAGLNAWLPLFAGALLQRLDVVDLAEPFGTLSSTTGLAVLAVALVADVVGDKVPAVDHVLHAIGMVVHPLAGAVAFTGAAGAETDLPAVATALAGAIVAGSLHAGRATVRPLSTAGTGGLGNPVLSLTEDAMSAILTALALLVPVLAVLVLAGLVAALVLGWRRLRRLRRSSASTGVPRRS
jgi:hypothetical protein